LVSFTAAREDWTSSGVVLSTTLLRVNATLAIGIAGLITTAAAPLLQTWLRANREEAAWRKDQQAVVYADAMTHVQLLEGRLDYLLSPETTLPRRPLKDRPHPDAITARMRLLAPQQVFDCWAELMDAEDLLAFYVDQGSYPEAGAMPSTDASMVGVQAAIKHFYTTMTTAL
jgi:type II secretory pathway pseudopilin PulG